MNVPYSKSHDSRPVVFVSEGGIARVCDYTVADSWKQSKYIFQKINLYSNQLFATLSFNYFYTKKCFYSSY